ncbi:hypothetical protein GCM10010954_30360 [Halobacillus andaensis]|uniref:Uncharacterized protein n=1 Tax=Halobacillus andaensis TaxID=1176239 RepID=A0A917B974_HALAA|nr:hypothetical protein [Halobacillus andaensis]MBP2005141.1 hypothetical protein [Halobacillus andaensis]GGF29144.1 hypothetical protein GCM10010954_30360 [Halobacillus andaensis]
MKNIKLNKAFNMEDNSEITFSKGLLLIDDKGTPENWTVSLSKVKEPEVFKGNDHKQIKLNLLDIKGQTYIGTAATDLITSDGSVLMKSKGALDKGKTVES